jgi:hypothetical protein
MAQELWRQAEKELGLAAQPRDPHTSEVSTETTQDLNLLAVWAEDNSDRLADGRIGSDKR